MDNPQKEAKAAKNPFAVREEAILDFWDEGEIFKRTVERSAPQGDYVFYDGPPFGTGEPHYGHILSSIAKDVVPRYFTMRGHRVERRWGWDCHGLPIENIIETDLGISGKKDIEKMGIAEFNEACRSRVLEYADVWEVMIRRIGRWVEFKDSYKTMDPGFMESVWWGFKQMFDNGLIYEGRRVLLYCPRCETPISNFEVAMDNSYRDITEPSLYVRFRLKKAPADWPEGVSIVAWTTTPWTLPGNVALAVGPEVPYVLVRSDGEHLVLARDRVAEVMAGQDHEVVRPVAAAELVGLEYEPLYDIPALRESGKRAHYVAAGDFVTTEDGTGVVHTAVVYGEDDYRLGQALDLPVVPLIDEKGHFNSEAPDFIRGKYFKKADQLVIEDLTGRGLIFKKADHLHSYPHCHRCDTQLFYNAIPAWFIAIEKIRRELIDLNENINWFPPHLKQGRFRLGIEQAPDWNISRNRYFATPIPVWRCRECGRTEAVGARAELEEHLGDIWVMRHGLATSNVVDILSTQPNDGYHLTAEGRGSVRRSAETLKGEGVELIIASDLDRAKETAAIASEVLGVPVVYDERLRETHVGDWEGVPVKEVRAFIDRRENGSDVPFPHGDNWTRQGDRIMDFYRDHFRNYLYRKVLLVSHADMLTALEAKLRGGDYLETVKELQLNDCIKNAEIRRFRHRIFDLHNHFIDQIEWPCACGGRLLRIREVLDCWVESGSMPFAQMHYPFENKERFEANFPAQYISEYISQTRAWFYVMHVISTAIFGKESFRNVVSTGVVLNEKGQKMSKSKKNYPDPWKVIDEFGVDALRLYLMGSSLMHAENLFFNERELRDVFRKNIMLLWNVYKFWETYRPADLAAAMEAESGHPLDRWIISRLRELAVETTRQLDAYDLPRAVRPMSVFIDDLSTWYIRRSRDRFKSESASEREAAAATTAVVLVEFAKLIAPFAPFIAEEVWQQVSGHEFEDKTRSVHLEPWPEQLLTEPVDRPVIEAMALVRRLAELGLNARDRAGIKVRQALAKATVRNAVLAEDMAAILRDELNVKTVEFIAGEGEAAVELDTVLTDELRREGRERDIIRIVNEMRKNAGLTVADRVDLIVETDDAALKAWFGGSPAAVRNGTVTANVLIDAADRPILEQVETELDGVRVRLSIAQAE